MENSIRIAVLQRGWVVVGRWTQSGQDVVIEGASVIRRWGSKMGLGELRDGPLKSTVLDSIGTVRVHELGVVFSVDCNSEGWEKHVANG